MVGCPVKGAGSLAGGAQIAALARMRMEAAQMTENEKTHFNTLRERLQRTGLLGDFQHALHAIVFPGKTHLPQYNIIWAIECSRPDQWPSLA